MNNAWHQVWMNIPVWGRQWAGWFFGNQFSAQALAESLRASAASSAGVVWEVFNQDGTPLPTGLPIPGLPGLPGLQLPKIF